MMNNRRITLMIAIACLSSGGSAFAASSAQAAQYSLSSYRGGPAVPVGTTFSATSGIVTFTSSRGTTTYWVCSSGTLSGKTDAIVPGGPQAGLSMTSGSLSGCRLQAGGTLKMTPNFDTPWQLTPVAGMDSPYDDTLANITISLQCNLTTSERYTGVLSTGVEDFDKTGTPSSGSQIELTEASSLNETGSSGGGCAGTPATVYVSGAYTLTQVGGSAVTSTNNLWENGS